MKGPYPRHLILWVFVAAVLSACTTTPPLRYFTLDAVEDPSQLVSADFYVSRVQVPEYLDGNRIWVRTEAHRIESLPHVRWAETLPLAFTRTLQLRLAPGIVDPVEAPRVTVDVHRFEAVWQGSGEPDRVLLSASWRIDGERGSGRATLEEPVSDRDPAALVATKSTLVNELAQRIADSAR